MRLLIQKVKQASITIDDQLYTSINKGLVVFIGISKDCNEKKVNYLVDKLLKFRIFKSAEKNFDLSVEEIKAEILIVSQFTLFAQTNNGRKPKFNSAMSPKEAEYYYNLFVEKIKEKSNLNIQTGKFQSMMEVSLINDGPITLLLEK